MILPTKRRIKTSDGYIQVYPCIDCGNYPDWGTGFLVCTGCNRETDMNIPRGASVRHWNKANKPTPDSDGGEDAR